MQSSYNDMSWFNSPSLPSTSSLSDPFNLGIFQYSSLPTPHRRAPSPPVSSPRRRRRPRHMKILEPALRGLFTLEEVDEMEEDDIQYGSSRGCASTSGGGSRRILSARASSEALLPSPRRTKLDLPQAVGVYEGDMEELVTTANRLSWFTASSTSGRSPTASPSPITPPIELDDPFFIDVPLDIDESDIDTSDTTFLASYPSLSGRPRRPPPLDLTRTHPYAYSAEINRWYTDVEIATPKSTTTSTSAPPLSQSSLLPSLPILSSSAYRTTCEARTPTTPRAIPSPSTRPRASQRKSRSAPAQPTQRAQTKRDPFDLVAALEDLLVTCGEPEDISASPTYSQWSDSSDSDSDTPPARAYPSFPLPPPRTPILSPASATSGSSFGPGLPTPRTPRHHSSLPPLPSPSPSPLPREQKKRNPVQPRLMSDHSFLFNLSSDATPSPLSVRYDVSELAWPVRSGRPGSRGSSGSTESGSSRSGRLPSRSRLPMEWTKV